MSDPIRTALERLVELEDTDLLCPSNPAETDWGAVVDAIAAARAALAKQRGEGPRLCWTENLPPSESCPYDHCIAETPFGRFLITWKSWKEYDSPTVDETPWGDWYDAFNSIDEAKAACQREFDQRLARCGPHSPDARKMVSPAEGEGPSHGDICQWLERQGHWGDNAHRIPRIANMVQDALARWGHQPAPALNQVFAGPTAGTGVNAPHFRFLTANDLPRQPVVPEEPEARGMKEPTNG